MLNDIRLAIRSLLRAPGFAIIAILTLALGIGANTAIFSVLYGVLLRPLPLPEPDRLVSLAQSFPGEGEEAVDVTWREYVFLRDNLPQVDLAVSTSVGLSVFTGTESERINALRVTHNYFRVLGVHPMIGRAFLEDEDQPGGANVVILSHALWQRRFASDRGILGRTISLNGGPYTVVGVMPADFRPVESADAWSTVGQVRATVGSGQNLGMTARLMPGVTFEQARSAAQVLGPAYRSAFADQIPRTAGLTVLPYQEMVVSDLRTPLRLVFGAIGLVLLIACANVASLVLGRAAGRGRELAVRIAVGATRGRVVRHLLTESVVLSMLGGAAGLVLASWGMGALLRIVPADITRHSEIHIDGWALLFTFGVALVTGVVFGLIPAWSASRADLHEALKEGAGRGAGTTRQARARSVLVIAEIALSLVLLVGAGLLMSTFRNLVKTETGFEPAHVLSAEIWVAGRYDSTDRISAYYRDLTTRLAALPGVQSAAVVEAGLPLQRGGNMPVQINGEYPRASIDYRTITPAYFATLKIPLREGRLIEPGDVATGEPVVVVSESFVKRFFPQGAALGAMIRVGGTSQILRRVVGVVGDVKSFIGWTARPSVYLPSPQTPAGFTRLFGGWFPMHVLVRTAGSPEAMRESVTRAIQETDAQVPVGKVRSMEEVLAGSLSFQRFLMVLLGVFAGLAMTLAAVGIYGVMSSVVTQRTHEIGVRMALGAFRRDVLAMVLRYGMVLAAVGAAIGIGGAFALTRLLKAQLFGVTPTDPLTFVVVSVLLGLVAMAACLVPAWRATRVDPIIALRSE